MGENMTKAGYTHIIVSKSLHKNLKLLAQQNNLSINQLIAEMLRVATNKT